MVTNVQRQRGNLAVRYNPTMNLQRDAARPSWCCLAYILCITQDICDTVGSIEGKIEPLILSFSTQFQTNLGQAPSSFIIPHSVTSFECLHCLFSNVFVCLLLHMFAWILISDLPNFDLHGPCHVTILNVVYLFRRGRNKNISLYCSSSLLSIRYLSFILTCSP